MASFSAAGGLQGCYSTIHSGYRICDGRELIEVDAMVHFAREDIYRTRLDPDDPVASEPLIMIGGKPWQALASPAAKQAT